MRKPFHRHTDTNAQSLYHVRHVWDVARYNPKEADIVIDLLCSFLEGAKSTNRWLQAITYLQAKLFTCSFMQIRKQTFSQDISTLTACGRVLHGHFQWRRTKDGSGHFLPYAGTASHRHIVLACLIAPFLTTCF